MSILILNFIHEIPKQPNFVFQITLGKCGDADKWPYGGSIEAGASFGANVVDNDVHEVCIDEKNKIITSPAFMYNGKFHEIQDGVSNMVNHLLKMI